MILTTTSEVIRIRRASAATSADMTAYAAWADQTTSAFTPGQSDVDTSAGGNVTLVAAPGASTQRIVTEITVYNADTASDTVTVDFYDGTNSRKLVSVTLPSLYSLHWQKETGWYVTDSSGNKLYSIDGKVATQTEQEAGSTNAAYVTPGNQHWHDSAAKCWGIVTVSGGVPTLQDSYNITSITDTGPGLLTFTIATDFSSANWACICSIERASTALTVTNVTQTEVRNAGRAAGSVLIECWDDTATTHVQEDPTSWSMVGFGDQ